MKKKIKEKKTFKYYGIIGKSDKFLYGAFDPSKKGLEEAKEYLSKIDSNKKYYKIKRF